MRADREGLSGPQGMAGREASLLLTFTPSKTCFWLLCADVMGREGLSLPCGSAALPVDSFCACDVCGVSILQGDGGAEQVAALPLRSVSSPELHLALEGHFRPSALCPCL